MKILIGYDGSEGSHAVLHDLKQAGLPSEAHVIVMTLADVFVAPPIDEETVPTYVPEAIKRAHERARQKLEQAHDLAKRASEQIKLAFPSWHVDYEAQADSPAWGLISKADRWKPDLIIMGARGHSVLGGRLILGSISQRVLYEARSSVRIARAPRGNLDAPVRLLIGVDHSAHSNVAVDAVCNRKWPKGSEVALLSVVDSGLATYAGPSELSQDFLSTETPAINWIEIDEEKNRDQVLEIFAPAMQKLHDAGLAAEVLIRHGDPADQIVEDADTWSADCIFLGAKGTRGIDRLLLGSVSSAVAARAHCSVEVVRPKE